MTEVDPLRTDYPEVHLEEEHGWGKFSPEVAWYIYDFFRFELTPWEKLVFYSYYINGLTLMDIAASADCTFQNIGIVVNRIEKKLHYRWNHRKNWKEKTDDNKSRD
jgi:predicted DNA-binding protein YlxM (UPF0122 family)